MNKEFWGYIVNGVNAFLTATQQDMVFFYVQLVLTIIGFIVSLSYTIYKWYKKAKADDKITSDEIKEIIEDVGDEIDNLKDEIKKEDKK